MKVSRRFQLAVNTVLFIAVYGDKEKLTCEYISKEMKCNPVVIKNILNLLYKNNFLIKSSSLSSVKLKSNIKDITLWDIYKITDEINIKNIFGDEDLKMSNPVVEDLPKILAPQFGEIIDAIKDTLSKVSIETLLQQYSYANKD